MRRFLTLLFTVLFFSAAIFSGFVVLLACLRYLGWL